MIKVPLIPGTLPGGNNYCPPNWQQFLIDAFSVSFGQIPSASNVWVGDTSPPDPVATPIWFRTNAGAPVYPNLWFLVNGVWSAKHPIGASAREVRWWNDTEANLVTFEGGDGNPLGPNSGPIWAVDHTWDGRSPMSPGAVPDTADTIAQGANYGHGQHVQTQDELAKHTHIISSFGTNFPSNGNGVLGGSNDLTGPFSYDDNAGLPPDAAHRTVIASMGKSAAMNWVHPVKGCFAIVRTSRIWISTPIS